MQRELSSLEYSVSYSTQAMLYTNARKGMLLFAKRQRGIFIDPLWGVQTHGGPSISLVPFRKVLARMNGKPQSNEI